ncbi:MAG: hypothetical protein ACKOJC_01755, partial [Actinomycetota bacterium]
KVVAQAFGRVAWPAFALAVVTGIWSILDVSMSDQTTSYQVTIFVHVVLVATSGTAAAIHSLGRSKLALALGGAIGLLAALAAMFVGLLSTSGA